MKNNLLVVLFSITFIIFLNEGYTDFNGQKHDNKLYVEEFLANNELLNSGVTSHGNFSGNLILAKDQEGNEYWIPITSIHHIEKLREKSAGEKRAIEKYEKKSQ